MGEGGRASRAVACLLSLVMTYLGITLMARYRQLELADAEWLAAYEESSFDAAAPVHGQGFQALRAQQKLNAGRIERFIPMRPAFTT